MPMGYLPSILCLNAMLPISFKFKQIGRKLDQYCIIYKLERCASSQETAAELRRFIATPNAAVRLQTTGALSEPNAIRPKLDNMQMRNPVSRILVGFITLAIQIPKRKQENENYVSFY